MSAPLEYVTEEASKDLIRNLDPITELSENCFLMVDGESIGTKKFDASNLATKADLEDCVTEEDLAGYAQTSDLAEVATTGNYNDLTNRPNIPAAQVNADWNADSGVAKILNKPSLSTVATTGSYTDLTNKPNIPDAQVNSDWNANSGKAQILNKPSIPTALSLAGAGLEEASSKLKVSNPVPNPASKAGKFLTVQHTGNTDEIVWGDAPSPSVDPSTIAGIGLEANQAGDKLQVQYDNRSIIYDATYQCLKVAEPVPTPVSGDSGKVLSVVADPQSGDLTTSWVTPQGGGGGGGGNPYTKTTLAAPDAIDNGHLTPYESSDYYDQTISISNNTYTLVSNVAYGMAYNSSSGENEHTVVSVENFNINLAQSDFPMAVVEFTLDEKAAVVNINVNNGNTALTRMYSTPYVNALTPDSIDNTGKAKLSFDTGTIQNESNYYWIQGIYSSQLSQNRPSFVTQEYAEVLTKVQIRIFGDTFNVLTSTFNDVMPAS